MRIGRSRWINSRKFTTQTEHIQNLDRSANEMFEDFIKVRLSSQQLDFRKTKENKVFRTMGEYSAYMLWSERNRRERHHPEMLKQHQHAELLVLALKVKAPFKESTQETRSCTYVATLLTKELRESQQKVRGVLRAEVTASETLGGRPFIVSTTECRQLVLASSLSEVGSTARHGNIIRSMHCFTINGREIIIEFKLIKSK